MPTVNPGQLLQLVDDFIKTASDRNSALEAVVELLAANFRHFTWVGIYLLEEGAL